MAAGLIRAVRDAERESQTIGSTLPIQTEAVRRSRDELLDLAQRLQSEDPAGGLGLRLARELLTDVDSPLYDGSRDLRTAVAKVRAALDGRHIEP